MTKIATHNAKFHTDDVFAVASLLILYPDAEIIRTRDEELIESADIVLDVGEKYDPEQNRFDHHQSGGAGERENGIPYASFGLVWKKFGEKITGSKRLSDRIDKVLVQGIDAPDNGKDICKSLVDGVLPFSLGSVVDSYRLTWKEEDSWDHRFKECVEWAKSLIQRIIKVEQDILDAIDAVSKTYNESDDRKIIVLDEKYDVGREVANEVLSVLPEPVYAVLFRSDHDNWQVTAVRRDPTTFDSRKPLPQEWRAKRDKELESVTGISGSIFCHRNGFMCVVKTKEGALELAKKALSA